MARLAVIGGSGFSVLPGLDIERSEQVETRYGETSAPVTWGRLAGYPVLFLPRHGETHRIPPHRVNYRANIRALADSGADQVVGLGAVGGITARCAPGVLCVPDQIIDYTHGRLSSFYQGEAEDDALDHVDFTDPYCESLRTELVAASARAGSAALDAGCYAATQGPRLESAAEIRRLERDGCDLVGMTGMPEAALARELGLCYASLCFVVNWAAGRGDGPVSMTEINRNLEHSSVSVAAVLRALAASRAEQSEPTVR